MQVAARILHQANRYAYARAAGVAARKQCFSAATAYPFTPAGTGGVFKALDSDRIHESVMPMNFLQASLPPLPVPKLEDTLERYQFFVNPLLNAEEQAATAKAVAEFKAGIGPTVHAHLDAWAKANPHTSYISQIWYDMYLSNRDPLPLNLNPQLTWADALDPVLMEQPRRAADIVYQAVRFHKALEAGSLVPDIYHSKPHITKNPAFVWAWSKFAPSKYAYHVGYLAGAYALDMSQYTRLFKSTRVPKVGSDELTTAKGAPRHIVVQRGPRFYKVNVMDEATGKPLPPDRLEGLFRGILDDSKGMESGHANRMVPGGAYDKEPPVGALTGMHRDHWAHARAALTALSPLNASTLQAIDEALFVLTLDDDAPTTHEEMSKAMLHGDARNRWYDKCFNLIVCRNGKAGVNWEHAWGDGVAVLYLFNEIYDALRTMPARAPSAAVPVPSSASSDPSAPQRLNWALDHSLTDTIRGACAFSDEVIGDTELRIFQSPSMTKDDIAKSHLNPDGVMQMILQLAHYRAHGYTPSTYESASTAGFKHGRTEVVRPVNPLSVAAVAAFQDKGVSWVQRYAALAKATNQHKKSTLRALTGQGVDRHLYALQVWCDRKKGTEGYPTHTPSIFTDPGYAKFKDIRLSTSTLVSEALQGGGFGPVSRHSYGVGYGTDQRGVHFAIMNYKRQDTSANLFAECCESALKDFHTCIDAAVNAGTIKPAKNA